MSSRDIPNPDDPKFGERVREELSVGLGFRGEDDRLDRFVRVRDLFNTAFRTSTSVGSSVAGPPGIGLPGPPGAGSEEPDLTRPPTPGNFRAVSAFSTLIIEWDAAVYAMGHGHGQTNIYGAKYSGIGPLPTFGTAVPLGVAPNALTIYTHPTTMGAQWHLWAKHQTADGVESASPAGGLNGVQVTTGLVGGADLSNLIITAEKLSQGTYGGINLVPNPGAEDGTVAWVLIEGTTAGFGVYTGNPAEGSQSFILTRPAGQGTAYGCLAMPLIPGETYSVKLKVVANASSAAGLFIRMSEKTAKPAGGYVTGNLRDSFTDLLGNAPVPAGWTSYEFTYTVPAGVYWASLSVYLWSTADAPCTQLAWDACAVGRQITASHLAAGSIAVGSAAIANAAITNAMLGTAIVDDAKIANLSAAKLTAGDGTIGGNLKSANYAGGSTGWIVRPDGYAEFGFAAIRGTLLAAQIGAGTITAGMLNVGSLSAISGTLGTVFAGSLNGGGFTSYVWPASGQTGYHLSASGLLLGNANDGRYFQVEAAGNVYAPGFTIINGVAKFANSAAAADAVNTINVVQGAVSARHETSVVSGSVPVTTNPTVSADFSGPAHTSSGGWTTASVCGNVELRTSVPASKPVMWHWGATMFRVGIGVLAIPGGTAIQRQGSSFSVAPVNVLGYLQVAAGSAVSTSITFTASAYYLDGSGSPTVDAGQCNLVYVQQENKV